MFFSFWSTPTTVEDGYVIHLTGAVKDGPNGYYCQVKGGPSPSKQEAFSEAHTAMQKVLPKMLGVPKHHIWGP